MPQSPEQPPIDKEQAQFTPEEERQITSAWYGDTSFEGRSSAEFKALRKELRKATILDFTKFQNDEDYARLIYENHLVDEFLTEETLRSLQLIYDERQSIGLSEEQFQKVLRIFDSGVQKKFREEIAEGGLIKGFYKQFSPEEMEENRSQHLAIMKKEIELQSKNISRPRPRLPFPSKEKNTNT
jgi:hypothetical protein